MKTLDRRWVVVVAAFAALSIADLALTLRLTGIGAREMNPLMASLLDAGWAWALLFKVSLTVLVAAGLWWGRRHQLVRRTGAGFVIVLTLVTLYQALDLAVA